MAEPELIGETLLRIFKEAMDGMTGEMGTQFDCELSARVDAVQSLIDILNEGTGRGRGQQDIE